MWVVSSNAAYAAAAAYAAFEGATQLAVILALVTLWSTALHACRLHDACLGGLRLEALAAADYAVAVHAMLAAAAFVVRPRHLVHPNSSKARRVEYVNARASELFTSVFTALTTVWVVLNYSSVLMPIGIALATSAWSLLHLFVFPKSRALTWWPLVAANVAFVAAYTVDAFGELDSTAHAVWHVVSAGAVAATVWSAA